MITVKDIARIIVSNHNVSSAEAEIFMQMIVEVINEGLIKDRLVKIKGLGTFKLQAVKERTSVNVNTGEKVVIAEHNKITFTPDNVLRDLVNKPFAQFETVVVGSNSPLLDEQSEFSVINEIDDSNQDIVDENNNEFADDETNDETDMIVVSETESERLQDKPAASNSAKETISSSLQESVSEVTQESINKTLQKSVNKPLQEADSKASKEADCKATQISVNESSQETVSGVSEGNISEETNSNVSQQSVRIQTEEQTDVTSNEDIHPHTENSSDDACDENDASDENDACREDDACETDDEIKPKCRNMFMYYGVIINIIIAIAAFTLGYLASDKKWFNPNNASVTDETKEVTTTVKAQSNDMTDNVKALCEDTIVKTVQTDKATDSTNKVLKSSEPVKSSESVKTSASVKTSEPTESKKQLNNMVATQQLSKIDAKLAARCEADARVRTGAYIIIGIDKEITVIQGQTLASISKAYLGQGMECYIEVLNNITSVKAGDKIKIPKLQLKKKKR